MRSLFDFLVSWFVTAPREPFPHMSAAHWSAPDPDECDGQWSAETCHEIEWACDKLDTALRDGRGGRVVAMDYRDASLISIGDISQDLVVDMAHASFNGGIGLGGCLYAVEEIYQRATDYERKYIAVTTPVAPTFVRTGPQAARDAKLLRHLAIGLDCDEATAIAIAWVDEGHVFVMAWRRPVAEGLMSNRYA